MKSSPTPTTGGLGLVYASSESSWVSCQAITKNLMSAYLGAFKNIVHFQISSEPNKLWLLAEEIFRCNPERLVFIDHVPHPRGLIEALVTVYGRKQLPICVFHVFGDFTLYSKDWLAIEGILKTTQVKFICASSRQKDLVSSFVVGKNQLIRQCPFPVNLKEFHFNPKIRVAWRKKLGLKSNDILYEIAPSKNNDG